MMIMTNVEVETKKAAVAAEDEMEEVEEKERRSKKIWLLRVDNRMCRWREKESKPLFCWRRRTLAPRRVKRERERETSPLYPTKGDQ